VDDLAFRSAPRISQARFTRILQDAGSPAVAEAQVLYTVPLTHGLDPAVALAFFKKESSYGTAGVNVTHDLKNVGNLRRAQLAGRGQIVATAKGNFVRYASWAEGLDDWCRLIVSRYIGRGLHTVRAALPVYAPSSDGNDPFRYAQQVIDLVTAWQDKPVAPVEPWQLWGAAFPLPVEQRGWSIPRLWLENAPWLGAATSPEMYVDRRPGKAVSMQCFEGGWIIYEQATGLAHLGQRGKR
jgi:hypothetical protein